MSNLLQYFPYIFGLLFFITEVYRGIVFKSKNKNANQTDKNSLKILWITIILSMFAGGFAIGFSNFSINILQPYLSYLGIFLALIGFFIRALAIHQLGKAFTVDVQISNNHQLKTDGMYSVVRNPSYTGALLSFLGLALTYSNYISVVVIIIPIFLAFAYRIFIEETALRNAFGEAFDSYAKQTKRLIPFIY